MSTRTGRTSPRYRERSDQIVGTDGNGMPAPKRHKGDAVGTDERAIARRQAQRQDGSASGPHAPRACKREELPHGRRGRRVAVVARREQEAQHDFVARPAPRVGHSDGELERLPRGGAGGRRRGPRQGEARVAQPEAEGVDRHVLVEAVGPPGAAPERKVVVGDLRRKPLGVERHR